MCLHAAHLLKFTQFAFCFRTDGARNLYLYGHVLIAMHLWVLHGYDTFSTQTDLLSGIDSCGNVYFQ